jgi:hypothetical protein
MLRHFIFARPERLVKDLFLLAKYLASPIFFYPVRLPSILLLKLSCVYAPKITVDESAPAPGAYRIGELTKLNVYHCSYL